MGFGQLLFLLIAALVLVLILTAKQHRNHTAMFDRKSCRRCGAVYPAHARFCGRCGDSLS